MTMHIARFRDSRMAVARRKTPEAAWKAAMSHGVPGDLIEVVPEAQHEADRGELPDMGTTYLNDQRAA
jgi:hypothetical protein